MAFRAPTKAGGYRLLEPEGHEDPLVLSAAGRAENEADDGGDMFSDDGESTDEEMFGKGMATKGGENSARMEGVIAVMTERNTRWFVLG